MELVAAEVPWAVVEVGGPDALVYLQGQLSQDVDVPPGDTTWTFLLQPTGKVDAWLRLTRVADDRFLLDAPCTDPAPIAARLERFKLRTKVEIEPRSVTARSFRGPGAAEAAAAAATGGDLVVPAGWPGVDGVDVLPLAPGPAPAVSAPPAWEALRIELGVPLIGRDVGPDTIPAEAGRWVIEASVSFTKGCYTGQELVARIDSRGGHVPRPLRGLVAAGQDAPPAGASLLDASGKDVGVVTSSAISPALGPVALAAVARSVEPGAEVAVRWDAGSARAAVRELPLR